MRLKTAPNIMLLTWALIVAAAVSLGLCVCNAQARPAPSGGSLSTVLAAARARVEATDVRATGRLVQVAADGKRTSGSIAIKARWFPDGLRMIVGIGSGGNSMHFLLTTDLHGRTGVEYLPPAKTSPTLLQPEHWGDALPGSIFSPEDLTEGQFLWTKQTLLPSQKYGARECFVLKSEPAVGERSLYSSVTTWIDQKTGAPVHVERTAKTGGPQKNFIYFDLRQTDGVWAARQVEAKLQGGAASSLLVLERGSARALLQRKDFNLSKSPPSGPGSQ